jgi:hypothetical protein
MPLMSAKDSPDVSWEEKDVEAAVKGDREVLASDMMQEELEDDSEARSEAGEKAMGRKP